VTIRASYNLATFQFSLVKLGFLQGEQVNLTLSIVKKEKWGNQFHSTQHFTQCSHLEWLARSDRQSHLEQEQSKIPRPFLLSRSHLSQSQFL